MARQRIVVKVSAGPMWKSGPVDAQPGWDEHAVFVDRLVEEGKFVMGGPFSDNSGSLMLYEGITADEARALMETDPFVVNGVFVVEDVLEWAVRVDRLSSA